VLTDPDGNTLATAVVTRDGSGYLTSQLPPAAAGQTYQLWGITRTGTISLGVLGREPKTVAFKAAAPTQSLAITTEVAGGVPVSQNAPDAVGDVA
jgi:anti-sigma-K factor RskA